MRKAGGLKRCSKARIPRTSILILTEGEKTEPAYFESVRKGCRTISVTVRSGARGTTPIKLVEEAVECAKGNPREQREYDEIYVVFDQDNHSSFDDAIQLAQKENGKRKNGSGKWIVIKAITSVPCFEIWLLLHYQDVSSPLSTKDAQKKIKKHLPNYDKTLDDFLSCAKKSEHDAFQRAAKLLANQDKGARCYTEICELVRRIRQG